MTPEEAISISCEQRFANVRDPYDACMRAATLVRRAGFVHRHTSMKSEASYYSLPDRLGLLRIAMHRSDNSSGGAGKTVARLTLAETTVKNISEEKFEALIALAIGQYILRAPIA